MVKSIGKLAVIAGAVALVTSTAMAGGFQNDLAFILKNNTVGSDHDHEPFSSFFNKETKESKMVILGGMRLYQVLISSQDMSACIFSPSCSRFGMRAISEFGLIHGGIMASDRLLRCHGMGKMYYPLERQTGLSLDLSVENYHLRYDPESSSACASGTCKHTTDNHSGSGDDH
jgi:putative component of membrane protein insertase Oxa1/YidC/SpoIIIJ protein YidD